MIKHDTIIGIDPDCTKSGVAILKPLSAHRLEVTTKSFPALLDYLKAEMITHHWKGTSFVVVVEAGWKNAISNFHRAQGVRQMQKIAKNVGSNHEVGRKIVEMCRHYDINVIERAPLRKIWKGSEGKITHDELISFTALTIKRSNQEERDAALLAWDYANLPIKIPTKRLK